MSVLTPKKNKPSRKSNAPTVISDSVRAPRSPTKRPEHSGESTLEVKAPRTPTRITATSTAVQNEAVSLVTPSTSVVSLEKTEGKNENAEYKANARRNLLNAGTIRENSSLGECDCVPIIESKKKLPFGGTSKAVVIPKNVRKAYHIVHKHTGSVGGNGHGGPIYGELTVGSMQKMVNLMVEHTNLGKDSRFIDVGCGLGKPNIHVAQDPGVNFSYGIELEYVRWMLGIANLHQVLKTAQKQSEGDEAKLAHQVYFAHGDITEAKYFDPFTHVYMFDIGFPPRLFETLATMFNRSQSEYLICYHGPKLMVDRYGFNVELLVQKPLSMHGSSEVHTGYIYRRTEEAKKIHEVHDNHL
mmetsp:Transcript_20940/g.43856  ORF Transcript_20940/g.43856 Transcript_20940/m.43856 type:complete len:356 (+) Transcript_20940:274-1341(+)